MKIIYPSLWMKERHVNERKNKFYSSYFRYIEHSCNFDSLFSVVAEKERNIISPVSRQEKKNSILVNYANDYEHKK